MVKKISMNPLRRGGCKCWLKHDQTPVAGVTVVWCIITDKQEMRTLSRDNVRICVLDMWVSFLDHDERMVGVTGWVVSDTNIKLLTIWVVGWG